MVIKSIKVLFRIKFTGRPTQKPQAGLLLTSLKEVYRKGGHWKLPEIPSG